jgi:multidrug efflux pump subunit AcrB
MNPAEFSLKHNRIIIITVILLICFGVFSYYLMPRQLNPDITWRRVDINTFYPGASPARVEALVTRPLEERLREINGIMRIDSDSVEGRSNMDVEFEKTVDIEEGRREVREKIAMAAAMLPEGAETPMVTWGELETAQLVIGLTSPRRTRMDLEGYARNLRQRLLYLPEVGRIEIKGIPEEQIKIFVDLKRLSQYGIPPTAVLASVSNRNVKAPSGTMRIEDTKMLLSTSGAYRSVGEIETTPVGGNASGHPVFLRDVATVVRGFKQDTAFVNVNGSPGVVLSIFMKKKHNVIWMGESVRAELADARSMLPVDVDIEILSDEPAYVDEQLSSLNTSLLIGMACVIVVMFVIMGLREALIAAVTIPLSLIIAFGGLSILDTPLHRMTIAGLVITLGLVVDNTIAVSDNIARFYREGAGIREAVVKGTSEVAAAISSGTLTTAAAFIPLMLTSGTTGEYIRTIPLAVVLTILASLAVALLVTPLMCFRFLKTSIETRTFFAEGSGFMNFYDGVLSLALRRPFMTTGITVMLLGTSILGASALGMQLFPRAARNQFYIDIIAPKGTGIQKTALLAEQVSSTLRKQPEVLNHAAFVGTRAPRFFYNVQGPHRASNFCQVLVNTRQAQADNSHRTVFDLTHDLRRSFDSEIVGASVHVRELEEGYGDKSSIQMYIHGDDVGMLRKLAAEIESILTEVDGVVNIGDSFGHDTFQLDIEVDEQRANLLGITHADVAQTLRVVTDGETITTLEEGDRELDIVVMVSQEAQQELDDLRHITFTSSSSGRNIPFSEVAGFKPNWTPSRIDRWQGQRFVNVFADTEGRLASEALTEIQHKLDRLHLPAGYRISFQGEIKELKKSFFSMGRAAIAAALLIYLILVAEFNSLAQPLVIALTLPLAFMGAAWGLLITGNPLGFFSVLGAVSLTGIVVNDAIVLIDFTNRSRNAGAGIREALHSAGHKRMRPIIMTTLTTTAGLLPLYLSGEEMWEPIGAALIFGLISCTILTLIVIPVMYMLVERRGKIETTEATTAADGLAAGL